MTCVSWNRNPINMKTHIKRQLKTEPNPPMMY